MSSLIFDPKTSALLVIDFQTSVVEMAGTDKDSLLAKTANLIDATRRGRARIIYIVVGFRPGYPEGSPRNQSFGPIRESGRFAAGSPGTEIHPVVAPNPGDVIVTKHRVSAFAGTDLDMILRASGIETPQAESPPTTRLVEKLCVAMYCALRWPTTGCTSCLMEP
jgi:nicotinamidase-related amidase